MLNRERLIIEINKAFESNVYPGNGNIAQNERDLEFESLEEFIGVDWRDITVDFIVPKHSSSLCLLTPSAFAYYVPTYMLASIKDYDNSDVIPNNLVGYFTVPCQEDIDELLSDLGKVGIAPKSLINYDVDEMASLFYERVSFFSKEQRHAIYEYLLFLKENHSADFPHNEPKRAIDRHWNRYASDTFNV